MKIAVILPCEIAKAPYIKYYTNILEECNIAYDIISWNRNYDEDNPFAYSLKSQSNSTFQKLISFLKYISYAIKTIKQNKYDILIIHTIVPMVLMSFFLLKYKGKFILDIRDYSSILKVKWFCQCLEKVINKASLVCISSNGYKDWLPKNYDYILSHNISKNILFGDDNLEKYNSGYPIVISTLGQIAYYEENIHLINSVRNNTNFKLCYYGYGPDEIRLKEFVSNERINNVFFYGKYEKHQEKSLYSGASFISCYCNDSKFKRTVMSNRFYLSLICGIPFIATANSIQAEIVEKYNIGLSIGKNDNITKKIKKFHTNFDYDNFLVVRKKIITEIKDDYMKFEKTVKTIIK